MPLPISALGAFHTVIGIIAVIIALIALVREGHIHPKKKFGLAYSGLTIVTCATALVIYRHGGFTPGHALSILTILAIAIAYAAQSKLPTSLAPYAQTAAMSGSLLFSLIPTVGETLTRLPPTKPFASGLEDPLVKTAFAILFAVFVLIIAAQLWSIKKSQRA